MKMTILLHHNTIFDFTPNWFDWLTLLLTIASIVGAYLVSESVFKREQKNKEKENKELENSENLLLKNNLETIQKPIEKQIKSLEEYTESKDFRLSFYSDIQVDFLQFISVKDIYKKYGFENTENTKTINSLMTNLYSLYDFRSSLRSEVRTYIEKYNYHEQKFYKYRDLLYTKYFELCNLRAENIINENGIKKFSFNPDDKFMAEFTQLRVTTFNDNEIIDNNGLKDRNLLVERFIKPLIGISAKFIPEDYNAIEISEIANQVLSAFNDMEHVTGKHMNAINGHIESLKSVNSKIKEFQELK
ncbi:hypothetical protein [Formosa algae]|uniref:Uncharacterized protein n=2 Tax=Formosa algae TaxID=225843 RepID=A0A9X1CAC1_9FLAO|nr:hypothetical protein [Formosa algae]MBP1838802.1 hypothetical protein [Formosa algae]MDQ0333579.1 hypothetical protein [Formosa algae]OEI80283.1 hypothetical protein AST99_10245 [Formosa algae]